MRELSISEIQGVSGGTDQVGLLFQGLASLLTGLTSPTGLLGTNGFLGSLIGASAAESIGGVLNSLLGGLFNSLANA